MHHIAIMRREWHLIEKVLSGEKTIESRWYAQKRAPWGRIAPGDTVFFKNSGEPVSAKATVSKVLQRELTPAAVRDVLSRYGGSGKIALSSVPRSYALYKDKRYCILVFLKDAARITPFDIDKSGFGNMAAWITVENVSAVKRDAAERRRRLPPRS